ncbi:hypothetical protein WKR88_17765 [Trinickia caryophylli]|uniref:hypothetical protein n=1 Tax=Trinickia caryophylli TaxID=28094 RepID=UPI000A152074|nr:hypothetical protein [Trinickia caryophylli]PMS14163.1 hypothetical protein C0Z17_01085 [Trinickia caryophylli]TRX17859.1 hypothetical protein FNF07_06220 [Trinickia caryophylli]WQE11372.1 hypothetical protein U0034_16705 [Trinickia caryophylli]GLU32530.1 hypothetical protein Busp01_23720 [Trinickia caryophylli]
MNDPRKQSNPTTRVAILVIVIVLAVVATLVFNALKGKREYEEMQPAASEPVAASAAASAATGASQ